MSEELFIRLYFDHHIPKKLRKDLRKMGFDVLATDEAGLQRAPDEKQLAFAAESRRAILTFNIRDFAQLHQEWQENNQEHAGIIISRQLKPKQYGLLLRRMERLLNHLAQDEMRNNLVHLEQFK